MEARWNFTVCSLIASARGDVAIGQAVRDEREHVMLARRQRFDQWLRSFAEAGRRRRDHSFRQLGAIDEFEIRIGQQPSTQRVEFIRRAAAEKHS